MSNLLDFCMVWECALLSGGSNKGKATIAIPANKFKVLFGGNPKVGKYPVPDGAGYFIEGVIVKKVIAK